MRFPRCGLMLLLACLLTSSASAPRIYGSILIPQDARLENATLKISDGGFSFVYPIYGKENYSIELPKGNYLVTAEFFSSSGLPPYSYSMEVSLYKDSRLDIHYEPPREEFPYLLLIIVFLLILVALFFFYHRYQEEQWRYYQEAFKEEQPLPESLPPSAEEDRLRRKKEKTKDDSMPSSDDDTKEEDKRKGWKKAHEDEKEQAKRPEEGEKEKEEEPAKEKKPEPIASFEIEFEGGEEQERPKESELPSDSRKILLELKLHKGRMAQAELKRILKYPESTLALVLAELEDYGFIKIRKEGKEKVVFLAGKEEAPEPTKKTTPRPKTSKQKEKKEQRKTKNKKPIKKKGKPAKKTKRKR